MAIFGQCSLQFVAKVTIKTGLLIQEVGLILNEFGINEPVNGDWPIFMQTNDKRKAFMNFHHKLDEKTRALTHTNTRRSMNAMR